MISRRQFIQGTGLAAASFGVTTPHTSFSTTRPLQKTEFKSFELDELTTNDLSLGINSGRWNAQKLSQLYLQRIEELDNQGPELAAIIQTNPTSLEIARNLDEERQNGRSRGPLHGIPIVVKDNVETSDPIPTTCGSLALERYMPTRDAFLISKLRLAGMIILAKSNLSEWANFRDSNSTSGWSAVRGQCRNPYALDYNPCGSSSGSAVAVSANLAPLAIGTETDGSIVCPASTNGVVGIKPTVGLISRSGIIPIATSQDTAGPIARTVRDAALLLSVLAGPDPDDTSTLQSETSTAIDYTKFLDANGLKGARIGVARNFQFDATVWQHFDSVLDVFLDGGATIVDPAEIPNTDRYSQSEYIVLLYEFKSAINAFLSNLGTDIPIHSLTELIEFNEAYVEREMPYFGQDTFRAASAQGPLTDRIYLDALENNRRYSRSEGIDSVMNEFQLDALVAPTGGLPWLTNYEIGDQYTGGSSRPAAVAGYPNITVPIGLHSGLPLGVSFLGRAWSEPTLLRLSYAFEQATNYRESPQFHLTAAL